MAKRTFCWHSVQSNYCLITVNMLCLLDLPPAFKNYFTWVWEFHDNATCNANKLHIRQPINENGRKMTKYHGAYIWNKLTDAVTKSSSFLTFKTKIKKHYLQLQNC